MEIESTELRDVLIVTPRVFQDARGFFFESYNQETWRANGIDTVFVQDNHSRSSHDTLRGLHFQVSPMEQVKLMRCLRGTIWDVAVDIRVGSPTFGRWVGVELERRKLPAALHSRRLRPRLLRAERRSRSTLQDQRRLQ